MGLQRVRHNWVTELNWWILEALDWLWEECKERLVNKLLGWNTGEVWDVSLRITGNILLSRVKGKPWILEALRRQPGECSSRELSMPSGAQAAVGLERYSVLLSKCLLVPCQMSRELKNTWKSWAHFLWNPGCVRTLPCPAREKQLPQQWWKTTKNLWFACVYRCQFSSMNW